LFYKSFNKNNLLYKLQQSLYSINNSTDKTIYNHSINNIINSIN
jgi:hypothetical protein